VTRAFLASLLLLSGCYLSHTIPCAVGADPELCEVAGALDGLRWELPCLDSEEPEVCSTEAGTSDELVFAPGGRGRFAVTLRFRGVVETKSYGGDGDGFFSNGGWPDSGPWNLYALEVASPPATYYLNHGETGLYHCFAIDYERTVTIAAGSRVVLDAQAFDGREIQNRTERGDPIVIPGVDPAPEPFDGQFIQMDVVDIRRVP
jgi:hypothetical protein